MRTWEEDMNFIEKQLSRTFSIIQLSRRIIFSDPEDQRVLEKFFRENLRVQLNDIIEMLKAVGRR